MAYFYMENIDFEVLDDLKGDNMKPHGNTGRRNAKKDNPKTVLIAFKCTPELRQCLQSRAKDGNPNREARRILEEYFNL